MVILRSDPTNVLLAKVWGPVFCIGISLVMLDLPSWASLLAVPVLIAALFEASLAILEVRGDVLRYRRLFKWTTIPEGDIVSARVVSPLTGSIRLKKLLFPWGRLYFVLDANLDPNPFRKGEYRLISYLRKEPILEDHDAAKSNSQKAHAAELRQVIAAVAGVLVYILSQLIFPRPPQSVFRLEPSPPVYAHRHIAIEIAWQISQLLAKFEVGCILFVVFTFLAIYQYRRADAWIYAFLAGAALPYILLQLL
jgi:hypothetical protein